MDPPDEDATGPFKTFTSSSPFQIISMKATRPGHLRFAHSAAESNASVTVRLNGELKVSFSFVSPAESLTGCPAVTIYTRSFRLQLTPT